MLRNAFVLVVGAREAIQAMAAQSMRELPR